MQVTDELALSVRAPLRMPLSEIERFVAENAAWAAHQIEKRRLWLTAHPAPTDFMIKAWRSEAKKIIPPLVARYAPRIAVTPAAVKITAAKKRFGSCSPKNSLCFSCLLMGYPIEAIEYVVVHELAHILHKNHGKEFYACIARVLPDYKARRALLKL